MQTNLHAYTAKVYEALTHPSDPTPSQDLVGDNGLAKYTEQQNQAAAALVRHLSTPAGTKSTKACCILLVTQALSVHTDGVSSERFAKHQNAVLRNTKSDAAFRIAVDLKCSERIDAMVEIIKSNKLIARDVVEQKNFQRFCESPEAYLARKFSYMRSNRTRQDKVDKITAAEADKRVKRVKQME